MDSGYLRGRYSDRAIAGAQVEVVQGITALYDAVAGKGEEGSWWLRGPMALGLSALYAYKVGIALHEFGHLSRGNAAGADVVMGFDGGSAEGFETTNYFSYLLRSLTHSRDHGFARPRRPIPDPALEANFSMGGVNAETYGAERLAATVSASGGHVLYAVPYLGGRLSSLVYIEANDRNRPGHDLRAIRDYYQLQRGFDIDFDDIRLDSAIALLASGTTYSLFAGLHHYFQTGDPVFRPLEFAAPGWASLRLPETSLYHSVRGLSLKVDSGYQVDASLFLPFGFEYVHRGDHYGEVNLGAEKKLGRDCSVRGLLYVGGQVSAETSIRSRLGRDVEISFGWSHYHKDTQYGLRHSTDLLSDTQDEVWLQVSYSY